MNARPEDLELLRSVLTQTAWLSKVRNNVDEARQAIIDAAQRVVDGATIESGSAPTETHSTGATPAPLARFHVMGLPSPKGSKTRMGKVLVEGSSASGRAKLRSWQDAVVSEASRQAATLDGPIDGPVAVSVTFRLPMPRSRPKWLQRVGSAPCMVKPDVDKLVRALLDSMVAAGLLRDDSIVVDLERVRKREVVGWTGAEVVVTRVTMPTPSDILDTTSPS